MWVKYIYTRTLDAFPLKCRALRSLSIKNMLFDNLLSVVFPLSQRHAHITFTQPFCSWRGLLSQQGKLQASAQAS